MRVARLHPKESERWPDSICYGLESLYRPDSLVGGTHGQHVVAASGVSSMNVETFVAGIRATESGSTDGNYSLRNQRSGAYGAYQMLERFWPDFLRLAARSGYTPETDSWPPGKDAQDTVFRGMVEYYSKKYGGNWGLIAVAWHCGHTCANAAVERYGTTATPNQINTAVADAKGGSHSNEVAYIRNVYTKSGTSFDPDATPGADSGSTPTEVVHDSEREGAMAIGRGHSVEEVVLMIQNRLLAWDEDSLPKWGADGDFGAETEIAVRSFQTVKGIASTGSVDGLTLALLQG